MPVSKHPDMADMSFPDLPPHNSRHLVEEAVAEGGLVNVFGPDAAFAGVDVAVVHVQLQAVGGVHPVGDHHEVALADLHALHAALNEAA